MYLFRYFPFGSEWREFYFKENIAKFKKSKLN